MKVALANLVMAATEGGAAAEEESGNFLVSPNVGLMIWTLLAFGITLFILRRAAFPRIADALDRRRRAIEESIDHAERTRHEADELLQEYRERLKEAREQAEDIVARARKAADRLEDEAKTDAKKTRDEMMATPARTSSRDARALERSARRWPTSPCWHREGHRKTLGHTTPSPADRGGACRGGSPRCSPREESAGRAE